MAAAAAMPTLAAAQDSAAVARRDSAAARCDGAVVSSVEIVTRRPDFSGRSAHWWRRTARAVGLHHHTTVAPIVRRFVSLDVGRPCTEFRRYESERILRAQPYLATATVRTLDDGAGGVRVVVVTEDEVPAIVSARLRRGTLAALRLGNENTFGLGLHAEVRAERGFAYRDGIGGRFAYNQLFGRPYTIAVEGERRPAGHFGVMEAGHPFLTDLQRIAWHMGVGESHDYIGLARARRGRDESQPTLSVRRHGWDVGGVLRVGPPGRLTLVGGALTGDRAEPEAQPVVFTGTGIVQTPAGFPPLGYPITRAVRLNVIGGLRAVRYRTVRGFDALNAEQDLASGMQINALVGRGVRMLRGTDEDMMLASQLYLGLARERSYVALQAEGEARRGVGASRWDGIVGSGRAAWYLKQRRSLTFITDLVGAAALRPRLPVTLTLGDPHGAGVRGFGRSHDVGERRLVARAEQRWFLGAVRGQVDAGLAAFADAGRLWAGASPYASSTPVSGALGFSLLAAVPRGAQRLWRVDVAFPVRGDADARWEVRVGTGDARHGFWAEPVEVTRARSTAGPARVFSWP